MVWRCIGDRWVDGLDGLEGLEGLEGLDELEGLARWMFFKIKNALNDGEWA